MTFLSALIGTCMILYVLSLFNTKMRRQAPYKHIVFGAVCALWMVLLPPTNWFRGGLLFAALILMIRYLYQTGSFSASVQGFLLFGVILTASMLTSALMVWLRGVAIDYRRLFAIPDFLYLLTSSILAALIGAGVRSALAYSNAFFDRIKQVIPLFLSLNIALVSCFLLLMRFHIGFSVTSYQHLSNSAPYMTALVVVIAVLFFGFSAMLNRSVVLGLPRVERRR